MTAQPTGVTAAVIAPARPGTSGSPGAGGVRRRGALRRRLRHLPAGLVSTAALLAVAVPVAGWTRGPAAAAGTATGVLLVAASFVFSSLSVAWADSIDPQLVLPVGLGGYAIKATLLGVCLVVLLGTGWAGLPAMGVGILLATLTWVGAQVWWTLRAKIPYVQFDE